MKHFRFTRIGTVIALLLAAYLFLTPTGALRLAVTCAGYPREAALLQVRPAEARDVGAAVLDVPAGTTVYRITSPAPYDAATGTECLNWAVTRLGPACTAYYYGWC